MSFSATPYLLPSLLAAGLGAWLFGLTWRQLPGSALRPFSWLILAAVGWSLGYALEVASADLPTKLFWARAEYPAVVGVPLLTLAFTLRYLGCTPWPSRRTWLLLGAVPALTLVVVATNDWHGLHWREVGWNDDGPFPALRLVHGPWFWVHLAWVNLVLAVPAALLLRAAWQQPSLYRAQLVAILVCIGVPWGVSTAYALGLRPLGPLNPTSIAFTVSLSVLWFALFRLRLLELMPVAHEAIVAAMGDGVVVLDAERRVVAINPAGATMLQCSAREVGRAAGELAGGLLAPVLAASAGEVVCDLDLATAAGPRQLEARAFPLGRPGDLRLGRVVLLRDMTGQRQAEAQLRRIALADALTGLPNRYLFFDRLEVALRLARREGYPVAVLVLDLDGFKAVNDRHGHECGDRLLVEVGRRLQLALRDSDTIARLGGDEFAGVLPDTDRAGAAGVAGRIVAALGRPFRLDGPHGEVEVAVAGSLGVAVYPEHGQEPDELLRQADGAMYATKRGQAGCAFATETAGLADALGSAADR